MITDPPYGLSFMGKDWDHGIPGVAFWKKFLFMCKPGAFALVFGGTRTYHRLACAIEDAGWEIRDCMMWLYGSGFPKSLDIGKAIDKAKGAKRESLGKDPSRAGRLVNQMEHSNPSGTWQAGKRCVDITAPATDLAKLWDGWGTALKPAWEPIIVAMKPLDGTFAVNAEKWGVGGLWIDGGRIEGQKRNPGFANSINNQQGDNAWSKSLKNRNVDSSEGRWPANLILDEDAAAMLDEQSGIRKGWSGQNHNAFNPYGENALQKSNTTRQGYHQGFNDSGGASRFFYCAKASKKERGEGNNHPTVKPLALMEYLCKLTKTPKNGIVFDPFGGSGTTALACKNIDRDCVIIEKEPTYCEIIRKRLND